MTRPTGPVSNALMAAAAGLATPGHGGTMREIAARACVGLTVAGYMVPKLAGAGHLEKINDRKVTYRSRPVAEYAPRGYSLAANPFNPDRQASRLDPADVDWSNFV